MNIKKGQIVTLKPEFLDPGEVSVPHIAVEDSFDGIVRVEAAGDFPGLKFKPINDWRTDWIAPPADKSTLIGTLAYEFPDFDASTLPEIPEGFVNAHWHNETMPHWQFGEDYDVPHMDLYIDYADPAQREFPESKRFTLHWAYAPTEHTESWLLEHTDDWAVILDGIEHMNARIICAKWVARFGLGFHPDTPGDDYVDGGGNRALTQAEASEYDDDMDLLCSLDGDPYEAGMNAMRVAGLL